MSLTGSFPEARRAAEEARRLEMEREAEERRIAEEKAAEVKKYIASLSEAEKALLYAAVAVEMPKVQLDAAVSAQMAQFPNRAAQEAVLKQAFASQGIPEETAASYIAEMTDEEVKEALVKMLEMSVKEQYADQVKAQLANLTVPQLAAALDLYISKASAEELVSVYDNQLPAIYSESTYEENESILGIFDIDSPSSINIYSSTFEAKDEIAELIRQYNADVKDDDKITYTDYIAIMMSSITTIINSISYILIAFVSISLVVSSIMIGIITYISVLERTKEIGILRAIGASKKDVGRVFNAETLIVGFAAGMIGIIVTLILNIPINIIIKAITDIGGIAALPWEGGIALVAISMILTLVAGVFPSKIAAKKDPVEALRSE
jgi:putative ABC transport system permease protein